MPTARSAASTFSAPMSAAPSFATGTPPRGRSPPPRCRSCSRRRSTTTPAATAVVFEDTSLTYGELDAHSSQLAHHLRALGVGPEVVVGLCVERSLEMLVGLLGILKAGGAYLPLDPDYPPERLAFMLADAGAPVLVTQSALRDRLPLHDARIVQLDADWPAIAARPASAPAAFLRPATPRLCHLHLRLNRNPEGRRRHACRHSESGSQCRSSVSKLVPRRRVLQFASLSYDAALWELASALLSGASIDTDRMRDQAQRRCVGQAHPRARSHACDIATGAAGGSAGGPAAADLDRRRRSLFRRTWWRAGRQAGG